MIAKLHFCPKYYVLLKYPFTFALIESSIFINKNDDPLCLQSQLQLKILFTSFLPSDPNTGPVRCAESVLILEMGNRGPHSYPEPLRESGAEPGSEFQSFFL